MPFRADDSIHADGLANQVEDCIAAGVFAVALALGSELPKLTAEERVAVIAHVVRFARGRVPVVVNTGADSVPATIARCAEARSCGADAVMIMAPYFLPAGPGLMPGYFRAVARQASLPVIVQDMAHAPLAFSTLAALVADAPEIIAFKVESHPTTIRVAGAVSALPSGMPVLGGHGGSYLIEELDRGAVGTMPFASQPRTWVQLMARHAAGDREAARALFAKRVAPVAHVAYQGSDLFYHVHKRVLVHRGVISSDRVRAPTSELDRLIEAEVEAVAASVAQMEE
jgi:4-hydroxy-tetrahydrodipicolinate synthase